MVLYHFSMMFDGFFKIFFLITCFFNGFGCGFLLAFVVKGGSIKQKDHQLFLWWGAFMAGQKERPAPHEVFPPPLPDGRWFSK